MQLMSILYCVLSILCFQSLATWAQNDIVSTKRLGAILVATVLPPILIMGVFAFGTIALLRRTVIEGGITFSWGIVNVSALWMSALVLQAAVTIQSYRDQMDGWEDISGMSHCYLFSDGNVRWFGQGVHAPWPWSTHQYEGIETTGTHHGFQHFGEQ